MNAHFPRTLACLIAIFAATALSGPANAPPPFEPITFASDPGELYLPLDEATQVLHWRSEVDGNSRCIKINDVEVPAGTLRVLNDGTELISASKLAGLGAESKHLSNLFAAPPGAKRVEVNIAEQRISAWQGSRLILYSRISSGRNGKTPTGNFQAGPFKARMHYSKRYRNAAMPWSVQINGHVFIHGFTSVPDYPASHGCIRLPLTGFNPAKLFLNGWTSGRLFV